MAPMHQEDFTKPDGRSLTLYGLQPIRVDSEIPSPSPEPVDARPVMRWHPLRSEWVMYAAHRLGRTFLPPPEYNPLAPTSDPEHPTELPRGQYDIALMGTATDNNDPDGLNNLMDGSLSPSYVRSAGLRIPELERLMAAGRAEFDLAKRQAIYRDAQKVALEQVPIIGLAWRSQGYGMRRELTGFKAMPGALNFFSGITLEEAALA